MDYIILAYQIERNIKRLAQHLGEKVAGHKDPGFLMGLRWLLLYLRTMEKSQLKYISFNSYHVL